jgi:hypothetical protein
MHVLDGEFDCGWLEPHFLVTVVGRAGLLDGAHPGLYGHKLVAHTGVVILKEAVRVLFYLLRWCFSCLLLPLLSLLERHIHTLISFLLTFLGDFYLHLRPKVCLPENDTLIEPTCADEVGIIEGEAHPRDMRGMADVLLTLLLRFDYGVLEEDYLLSVLA